MRVVRCGCCERDTYRLLPDTGVPGYYACDACDAVQNWPVRYEEWPPWLKRRRRPR